MGIKFNGNNNPFIYINSRREMKPGQPEEVIERKKAEGNKEQKPENNQEQKSQEIISWEKLDYKLIYDINNIKVDLKSTNPHSSVTSDSSASAGGAKNSGNTNGSDKTTKNTVCSDSTGSASGTCGAGGAGNNVNGWGTGIQVDVTSSASRTDVTRSTSYPGTDNVSTVVQADSTGSASGAGSTGASSNVDNAGTVVQADSTGSASGAGGSTGASSNVNNVSTVVQADSTGSASGAGSTGASSNVNNTSTVVQTDSTGSVSGTSGTSGTGDVAPANTSSNVSGTSYDNLTDEEYIQLLINSFNVYDQYDATVQHDFYSSLEPDSTHSINKASIHNYSEYKNMLLTVSNEVLKNVVKNMKKNGLPIDVNLIKTIISLTNFNLSRVEIYNELGEEVSYSNFYNYYADKFNQELEKFLNSVDISSIREKSNPDYNVSADETVSSYREKLENIYLVKSDEVASNEGNLDRTVVVTLPTNYKPSIEQGTCVKLRETFDSLLNELVHDVKEQIIKNCYMQNITIDYSIINNAVNYFKQNFMNYKSLINSFTTMEVGNSRPYKYNVTIDVQGFKTYALSYINSYIYNTIQNMEPPASSATGRHVAGTDSAGGNVTSVESDNSDVSDRSDSETPDVPDAPGASDSDSDIPDEADAESDIPENDTETDNDYSSESGAESGISETDAEPNVETLEDANVDAESDAEPEADPEPITPDVHDDYGGGRYGDTYYEKDDEGNITGGKTEYYYEKDDKEYHDGYDDIERDNNDDGSYTDTTTSYEEDGSKSGVTETYHENSDDTEGTEVYEIKYDDDGTSESTRHIYTTDEDGDPTETAIIETVTDEDGNTTTTTTEDGEITSVIVTDKDGNVISEDIREPDYDEDDNDNNDQDADDAVYEIDPDDYTFTEDELEAMGQELDEENSTPMPDVNEEYYDPTDGGDYDPDEWE